MPKYEINCYGKDGAKFATVSTDGTIEEAIDHLPEGTAKILVHDGETGNYITEA